MNTPQDVIAKILTDNSKNFKVAAIAAEAKAGNEEFFEGLRYAFDALITFGIAKVPVFNKITRDYTILDWADFKIVLEKLRNREATGHAARDLILDAMRKSNGHQWDGWYRKILMKDMKAGFSESSVNKGVEKTHPKYVIPVFECQLAKDSNDHPKKMTGKKIISSKLDGVRALTLVYLNGEVEQFSRNGKELRNFGHVKDQFAKIANKLSVPTVFDGEIMSGQFQDLMKQIHRKSNVTATDAVLNLFDFLPLDEFLAGESKKIQTVRSAELAKFYADNKIELPNVTVLDNEVVDLDTEEGKERFKEINRLAINMGLEGIMIYDPNAKYECKRGFHWMKKKPVLSLDLTIIDVEIGSAETKNCNTLGALVCEGDDQGRKVKVNVGGGYTESQRDEFWANKESLIGQIVEIECDALTKPQNSDVWSVRFPIFVRFRGFEIGEKL